MWFVIWQRFLLITSSNLFEIFKDSLSRAWNKDRRLFYSNNCLLLKIFLHENKQIMSSPIIPEFQVRSGFKIGSWHFNINTAGIVLCVFNNVLIQRNNSISVSRICVQKRIKHSQLQHKDWKTLLSLNRGCKSIVNKIFHFIIGYVVGIKLI